MADNAREEARVRAALLRVAALDPDAAEVIQLRLGALQRRATNAEAARAALETRVVEAAEVATLLGEHGPGDYVVVPFDGAEPVPTSIGEIVEAAERLADDVFGRPHSDWELAAILQAEGTRSGPVLAPVLLAAMQLAASDLQPFIRMLEHVGEVDQ